MTPLDVMLKEYAEIRAEIARAMERRFALFQYGVATVGGALSAGVALRDDKPLSWFIIAVLAPTLAWTLLFMWIGEYARTQRAGKYGKIIEDRVNAELRNGNAMGWENYLLGKDGSKNKHMMFGYAVQCIFVVLAIFGCYFSAIYNFDSSVVGWWVHGPLGATYLLLAAVAAWRFYHAHDPAAAEMMLTDVSPHRKGT